MTMEVIKALNSHLKFKAYEPYWIIGCDGCYNGHSECIADCMGELGFSDFIIVETKQNSHSYGKIINLCLNECFKINSLCLLVENDWLCVKDIYLDYYTDVMKQNPVAQISFKFAHSSHGLTYHAASLSGVKLVILHSLSKSIENVLHNCKGYDFIWGEPRNANCPVDMGVAFYSRKLFQRVGKMKEGIGSQDSEEDLMHRYNRFITSQGLSNQFLKLFDANLFDIGQNGNRLAFIHVGKNSQHGWNWEVPQQYHWMSNEQKDIELCMARISKS